ncbi:phage tail protein [Metaclostridioides mangenotii]|uniref:phage tail protein n=1 Tax=Metaclostridioides mangenotii TaxID=1540 RepID=UPI0028F0733E|nr:phage tail protein [Clostridioides mangenotii]
MAEQFYTILTKIGKSKIANATALGEMINLTSFKVGDSNGAYYNPTEEQTELRNVTYETNINSIDIDENNPSWIVIEVVIPGNIGGFTIREAAAYDNLGNMIAVGKYPETYKPLSESGSTKDLIIKMILEVSNSSAVTLKIDPTAVFASKKDLDVLENKIKKTTGDKNNLITKDKSNIVNAINEVATDLSTIELTGNKVTIEDADNNFKDKTVERALKELATKDRDLDTRVGSLETEVNGQRLRAIDALNSIESKL